jgi:predicted heme/steroid binding protein
MRTFTLDELKSFDGKDGRPAYVALNGKVYDVTDSPLWKDGGHQFLHQAGIDLTEDFEDAPHDMEVFDQYPQVGELGI